MASPRGAPAARKASSARWYAAALAAASGTGASVRSHRSTCSLVLVPRFSDSAKPNVSGLPADTASREASARWQLAAPASSPAAA